MVTNLPLPNLNQYLLYILLKHYLFLITSAAALCSCETTQVTPQQAIEAAEAARLWVEVAKDAKTIILDEK